MLVRARARAFLGAHSFLDCFSFLLSGSDKGFHWFMFFMFDIRKKFKSLFMNCNQKTVSRKELLTFV